MQTDDEYQPNGEDWHITTLNAMEILEKFNIELEGQRLTRGGTEIQAHCPFHEDKTPSFYLNVEKLVYQCFGCQAAGFIYDVIEQRSNLTRDEVREALKGQLPPHYKRSKRPYTRERFLNEIEIDILTTYADGFHTLLKNEKELSLKGIQDVTPWQRYLTEVRGFTWDAIRHFHLGANSLRNYNSQFVLEYTRKAYNPEAGTAREILQNLNLYNRADGDYYWKPAIIIPYRYDGQTFYLNARILPEHEGDGPRYMGMSGITREMFFNEDALDEYENDDLFAVEGEFNAVAMWDAGIKNVVSFGGTGQLRDNLISKLFGRDVILYFDTDAGDQDFKARQKAIDELSESVRSVSYFELPEGMDINAYLKTHSPQQFQDEVLSRMVRVPSEDEFGPGEYRLLTEAEKRQQISLETAQRINAEFMAAVARNLPAYAGQKILNNMPVGTAKTTGAIKLLNDTKNDPALVLASAHYLATDYDDQIDFDRFTVHLKGRSHADIQCPYAAQADYWASRGYGLYFKIAYCRERCEKKADCKHIQLLEAARTAPVLIATHAHGSLKDFFTSPYYGNNRRNLIIIDEEADLCREVHFSRDILDFNRKALLKARDILIFNGSLDNLSELQQIGALADDLARMLGEMEAARFNRSGYKPNLQPFSKKETYHIDKTICLNVRDSGMGWTERNILHDLVYVINRSAEFMYDARRDALYYVWRAEFPEATTVIFLTGTTPKEYLEKTLNIDVEIVIGQQYYVRRENLKVAQLLNVTGGRQRVLWDTNLQENIKTFFRLALAKHKDEKILILTSQGANIRDADVDGTAKERIIKLLSSIAFDAGRHLVQIDTEHLEEGALPLANIQRDIPVIHYGVQGTNMFEGYEVLIEINAHFYHQQAIVEGVRRNFGVDVSDRAPEKKQVPFRTLDAEYMVERYVYGDPAVDLYIRSTQEADVIQAEGRILRGEDTSKVVYRLHNVNVEPFPDRIYKSWKGLFQGEFGYQEMTGKLKEVLDWIQQNKQSGDEFTTRDIADALGGTIRNYNRWQMKKLEEMGYIANLSRGQKTETRWRMN